MQFGNHWVSSPRLRIEVHLRPFARARRPYSLSVEVFRLGCDEFSAHSRVTHFNTLHVRRCLKCDGCQTLQARFLVQAISSHVFLGIRGGSYNLTLF